MENRDAEVAREYDILEIYHENSKNVRWMMRNRKAHQVHYEKPVLELMARGPKAYENRVKLVLPRNDAKNKNRGQFERVMLRRRSSRNFSSSPMSLQDLTKILFFANGITDVYVSGGYRNFRRNVPSSGNLGSIEIYPLINRVEGVEPGIYHYDPLENSLACLKSGDFKHLIMDRMIYQPEFADAAVLLITSALIDRVRAKYGDRAYRYVHLDAGHVGENVYLTCAALSLGCCATAGFIDNEVNDFIGIDGINETVVYILAIGYDAPNSQEGPYNYA